MNLDRRKIVEIQERCSELRRHHLNQYGKEQANEMAYFEAYRAEIFPDELQYLRERIHTTQQNLEQELLESKLLFLLVGRSREPGLFVTCLHQPEHAVLIHTEGKDGSEWVAQDIQDALDEIFEEELVEGDCPEISMLMIDGSDPEAVCSAIVREWEMGWKNRYAKESAAIDMTGGKNTMVAGAYLAAEEIGLKTYYLDSDEYDTIFRLPRPATYQYRRFPK